MENDPQQRNTLNSTCCLTHISIAPAEARVDIYDRNGRWMKSAKHGAFFFQVVKPLGYRPGQKVPGMYPKARTHITEFLISDFAIVAGPKNSEQVEEILGLRYGDQIPIEKLSAQAISANNRSRLISIFVGLTEYGEDHLCADFIEKVFAHNAEMGKSVLAAASTLAKISTRATQLFAEYENRRIQTVFDAACG